MVTTDWMGTTFAGINLYWNYTNHTCHLIMNGYIAVMILKYDYTPPNVHNTPHTSTGRFYMEPRCNSSLKMTLVHCQMQPVSNEYKVLWAHCYNMPEL